MDIIVAPITEAIAVESNKPDSIVVGSTGNSITNTEVYNVITEKEDVSVIQAGQPGPRGPVGPIGPMGPTGSGGVLGNYGSFLDTTTQELTTANVGQPIYLNTTLENRNVRLVDGHKIVFDAAGTYSFTFSCQFTNDSNDVKRASLWLHYQGVNYPNSASHVSVNARHGTEDGKSIVTVNFVATALGTQDFVEIYWAADSTSVALETVGGYDGVPVSPSIILTVVQVMYTQIGPVGPEGPPGLSEDAVAYARQTDFVGEDVIYRGEAEAGSPLTSPLWRIRKITIVNDDISESWADGNTNFDNVWSDRYTLTYT